MMHALSDLSWENVLAEFHTVPLLRRQSGPQASTNGESHIFPNVRIMSYNVLAEKLVRSGFAASFCLVHVVHWLYDEFPNLSHLFILR